MYNLTLVTLLIFFEFLPFKKHDTGYLFYE